MRPWKTAVLPRKVTSYEGAFACGRASTARSCAPNSIVAASRMTKFATTAACAVRAAQAAIGRANLLCLLAQRQMPTAPQMSASRNRMNGGAIVGISVDGVVPECEATAFAARTNHSANGTITRAPKPNDWVSGNWPRQCLAIYPAIYPIIFAAICAEGLWLGNVERNERRRPAACQSCHANFTAITT